MEIKKTEQYAKELIKICGYSSKNTESRLYALLYHQYAAIALYETASAADKAAVDAVAKKLKNLISIKFSLKESGRRRKKEKENAPTPQKEIIKKQEESPKKTSVSASREVLVLDERQKAFWKELSQYIGKPYDLQLVQSFFCYWAEEVKNSGKMLWETRRSWNLRMRLASWSKRSYCIDDHIAQIKLQKITKRKEVDNEAKQHQQAVAAIREQDNERREREQEQSKQNQELTDDYLKRNPNGLLARWAREKKTHPSPPCEGGGG